MRIARLAVVAALLGVFQVATVCAQDAVAPGLRQPGSMQQAAFEYDKYIAFGAGDGVATSPSDQTPAREPSGTAATNGEAKPAAAACQEVATTEEDTGFKLFKSPCLEAHHIDIRGWLDQGYTWNPDNPVNRSNSPVAYNDRANEYQMNQLYLITERVTKTNGCGWDIGGRVDMLYGTDRRFPVAEGLDSSWNESERFYGLVMPQLYADFAWNDLILRAGHILAPCGYESVMATENFFYSHSYSFLYEQPTTLTGGQLIYKLNDQLSVNGGVDTGWNDWTDVTNKLSYYGGFNWTSKSKNTAVGLEIFSGAQIPGVDSLLTHYCLVVTQKLGPKWKYAFENNFAVETNAPLAVGGRGEAQWYDIGNYLFYEINECWSVGMRYEWAKDRNGVVIPSGLPAAYNALTGGVNYKPNKNVIVRSEVRGDWATTLIPTAERPFDDLTRSQQFLWATDLIVRF